MIDTPIGLVVVIVLLGGAIAWARFSRPSGAPSPEASVDAEDFPPTPKWKPTVPVDVPRTAQTFAYYIDSKRAFAVFSHGTCVVLPIDSKDEEKDAKEILDRVYQYHPDFNPNTMDDGHVMVSYSEPAFSVVFKDEFEEHRDYIDRNHLDGVFRAEVLLTAEGQPYKFDDLAKMGLFGRARMFLDAQTPVVVQIWRPQP